MIESLFTWLSTSLSERFDIALLASFGWGVASILLSPCHLSSIPLVVGYISSRGREGVKRPYALSLVFALGILVTIALIGAVTASAGRMLGDIGIWGNVFVACVFFVMGLYLMDAINLPWDGIVPKASSARGYKGAFVLGLIFGVGLGPCAFAFMAPVLGVVFSVAAADMIKAISLLAAFAAGHCGVIAMAGGAVGTVQKYLNWTGQSKAAAALKHIAGALVFLAGVYFIYTLL